MTLEVQLKDLDSFSILFWNYVADKKIFAFHGEMGAGKTTIIGALCKAQGVQDVTASPTFSIINEYEFRKEGKLLQLYHIDLYRLKSDAEIIAAGVEECLQSGFLCLVEWPARAPGLFDEQTVHVIIQYRSEKVRSIRVMSDLEFNHLD